MRRALALSILAVLLLSTTALSASSAPAAVEMQRYVIAGGGGRSEAGDYVLHGAAGQPVAGTTANPPYDLCAGFWCGAGIYTSYLPLALHN
ncbi:MAG: hypothetical protein JW918_09515 [Anaerolineae bacterium]|nr:hypothetical protein [Anaerolineae bacterium]